MRDRVAVLVHAFRLSRCLGDALAWYLLGFNERAIVTLSLNDRSRSLPDEPAVLGMLSLAQGLASDGLGVPVLHDITNCLRIGDISLYRPGREIVTVEVKTRASAEQGRTRLDVEGHSIMTPEGAGHFIRPMHESRRVEHLWRRVADVAATGSPTSQTIRQLQRLAGAKVLQQALPNTPCRGARARGHGEPRRARRRFLPPG